MLPPTQMFNELTIIGFFFISYFQTLQHLLDNIACGFVSLKDYLPTDCLNETFLHKMHKEMEDFIVQVLSLVHFI
jgi:hypothetical protein